MSSSTTRRRARFFTWWSLTALIGRGGTWLLLASRATNVSSAAVPLAPREGAGGGEGHDGHDGHEHEHERHSFGILDGGGVGIATEAGDDRGEEHGGGNDAEIGGDGDFGSPPPHDGGGEGGSADRNNHGIEAEDGRRRSAATTTTTTTPTLARRPNMIFILTDDQDVTANSLDYMPNLNQLLRSEGTEFVNFFVPTGLCCPSRSTILRGQYCHNTDMYDNGDLNNATYRSGGFDKFAHGGGGDGDGASSLEGTTVATMLTALGYDTALVGKYINGYEDGVADHVPPGWSHWMGLTRTFYYGPHFSNQGKLLQTSKDVYQTDFIRDEVHKFLTGRRLARNEKGGDGEEGHNEENGDKPFFLYVAPFAPHAPATPAERHMDLFNDVRAPRYPSFNPTDEIQSQKPSWIKSLPPLTPRQIEHVDEFYRNRLRSLQAVDEMLLNVTSTLSELGMDDETYVFYMGDNGQHLGDFRMPPGKRQAYDTDVRVPFLVRGPGVKEGGVVTEVVQSVDLLPTWLSLASRIEADDGTEARPKGRAMEEEVDATMGPAASGALADSFLRAGSTTKSAGEALIPDGKSIVPLLNGILPPSPTAVNVFRSAALLEMYGGSSITGPRYAGMPLWWGNHFWNNTYQAVRVINGTGWARGVNLLYVEWCTGERELYDCDSDPHQIRNRIDDPPDYGHDVDGNNGTSSSSIVDSLSVLVSKLGSCAGRDCHGRVDYDAVEREGRELSRRRRQRSAPRSGSRGRLLEGEDQPLRCFNPPHLLDGPGPSIASAVDAVPPPPPPPLRRRSWAMDEYVPEPFVHGFPFSDSDVVPPDLLEAWEGRYFSYFY